MVGRVVGFKCHLQGASFPVGELSEAHLGLGNSRHQDLDATWLSHTSSTKNNLASHHLKAVWANAFLLIEISVDLFLLSQTFSVHGQKLFRMPTPIDRAMNSRVGYSYSNLEVET